MADSGDSSVGGSRGSMLRRPAPSYSSTTSAVLTMVMQAKEDSKTARILYRRPSGPPPSSSGFVNGYKLVLISDSAFGISRAERPLSLITFSRRRTRLLSLIGYPQKSWQPFEENRTW